MFYKQKITLNCSGWAGLGWFEWNNWSTTCSCLNSESDHATDGNLNYALRRVMLARCSAKELWVNFYSCSFVFAIIALNMFLQFLLFFLLLLLLLFLLTLQLPVNIRHRLTFYAHNVAHYFSMSTYETSSWTCGYQAN